MLMQFPKNLFFQKMNYPPPYDQAVSSQGGIPPSGYGSTAGGILPPGSYGAFPPGSPHGGYPNQAGFPPGGYPGIQNHGDYPPGVHQKVPPHGPMGFHQLRIYKQLLIVKTQRLDPYLQEQCGLQDKWDLKGSPKRKIFSNPSFNPNIVGCFWM